MTIDTKHVREQIRRASPLPWMLATSNSWRRIVDFRNDNVCQPITQHDGHPDLLFAGGVEGPNAMLLIGAVNALPELLDEIERLRTRLEVNPKAPEIDGIYCRDETIRGQDELIDELRVKNKRLREALERFINYAENHGEITFAGGGMPAVNAMNEATQAARAALQESTHDR